MPMSATTAAVPVTVSAAAATVPTSPVVGVMGGQHGSRVAVSCRRRGLVCMRVVGRGAVVAVILGLLLFGINLGLLAEVEIVPLVDCGGAHDQDAARSVFDKDLFAPLHLKRQDAVILEQVLVEHHARHVGFGLPLVAADP